MSRFFKPYEGTRPFLFVSYAHRQSEEVVATIRLLHEKGCRLWYDEGIPAGSDWPDNIARHMESCGAVLFFLSRRSLESPNCYSEMRTAFRAGRPILVIRLEEAEPDSRWEEILRGREEIPLLPDPAVRAEAIRRSRFLSRRYYRSAAEKIPWRALGLIASLLFFLAAAGALAALVSGRWDPFPARDALSESTPQTEASQPAETSAAPEEDAPSPYLSEAEKYFPLTFPDVLQERGIRRALSVPEGNILRGELAQVRALYFCGSLVTDSWESISFDADGTCRVNGVPVPSGPIRDLSLLQKAVCLEELALICQPLEDPSLLSGHLLLKELSLAGSAVRDLNGLTELPRLEILHLEHSAVRDLRPLSALPRLKTVTVSRDMLPLIWEESAGFDVVLLPEGG